MTVRTSPFALLLLLLLLAGTALALPLSNPSSPTPLTIFVDCDSGSDAAGNGSAQDPLASPTAARDRIRSLQPLASDVIVSISGTCSPCNPDGSLNLSLPVLALSSSDSAPDGRSISYTSATAVPVLMGGVKLDSWLPYKGPIMQAHIPDAALRAGASTLLSRAISARAVSFERAQASAASPAAALACALMAKAKSSSMTPP